MTSIMPNTEKRILEFLERHPEEPLRIAVGYASVWGLAWLNKHTKGRPVELFIGNAKPRYFSNATEPDRSAAQKFLSRSDVAVRNWYRRHGAKSEAHLKAWVVQTNTAPAVLMGSANLTRAGIQENHEAMGECSADDASRTASEIDALWKKAWDAKRRLWGYLHKHSGYLEPAITAKPVDKVSDSPKVLARSEPSVPTVGMRHNEIKSLGLPPLRNVLLAAWIAFKYFVPALILLALGIWLLLWAFSSLFSSTTNNSSTPPATQPQTIPSQDLPTIDQQGSQQALSQTSVSTFPVPDPAVTVSVSQQAFSQTSASTPSVLSETIPPPSAVGIVPAAIEVVPWNDLPNGLSWKIVNEPGFINLRVRVTNAEGRPVPNAKVNFYGRSNLGEVTDIDGIAMRSFRHVQSEAFIDEIIARVMSESGEPLMVESLDNPGWRIPLETTLRHLAVDPSPQLPVQGTFPVGAFDPGNNQLIALIGEDNSHPSLFHYSEADTFFINGNPANLQTFEGEHRHDPTGFSITINVSSDAPSSFNLHTP